MMGWIINYVLATPGTECADNAANRLDNDNELRPDVPCSLTRIAAGQHESVTMVISLDR